MTAPRSDDGVLVGTVLAGLLVVGTVGLWGMRAADADAEERLVADTAAPMRFELQAGRFSDAGPAEEFAAYYPDVVLAHPGDTIVVTNPTADDPHTITFGLDADRADQPRFGTGDDHAPVIDRPCASDVPLTAGTTTCDGATEPLPAFEGQAYYSSGIIAPGGGSFELRLDEQLAPGRYEFACLVHGRQVGVLEVVVHGEPTQRADSLTERATDLAAADDREVARLRAAHTNPAHRPPDGHVRAGAASDRASSNVFVPASVTVEVGETVTWHNDGSVPHVMVFGGDLPPERAIVEPPTVPSGSDLPAGLVTSGPIGAPPYPTTSYTLRFTRPGTFAYTCTFHAGMSGTVTVVPAAGARQR